MRRLFIKSMGVGIGLAVGVVLIVGTVLAVQRWWVSDRVSEKPTMATPYLRGDAVMRGVIAHPYQS